MEPSVKKSMSDRVNTLTRNLIHWHTGLQIIDVGSKTPLFLDPLYDG
jgi:hypothetical protein